MEVGAPVSSLYGAPVIAIAIYGVPSVFAYLVNQDLAFTDIPESFNPPFRQKAARLQASALTN